VTFRVWPRSLAARTAVVLLLGLTLVQVAGLVIHGLDRIDMQRLAQGRDVAERVVGTYRSFVATPPERRPALLASLRATPRLTVELADAAPANAQAELTGDLFRLLRVNVNLVPLGLPDQRWREVVFTGGPAIQWITVGFRLPEGKWLHVTVPVEPARPWHSPNFLIAFVLMSLLAALLTIWAVRRLTAPVATLAAAAQSLGRDVNAPPLPETGPLELAGAAAAFNTMAGRIRRFVADRTELLTAIGHDLRTPITRLKLRAEFMPDEEQRTKMLADLAELEAMVSATLAFGRASRTDEPTVALDLAELLRTVLDEARDTWPEVEDRLVYEGPAHLTVRARSLALKRALTNLVTNAVKYGGSARARLTPPIDGLIRIEIEDDGPGVPPGELDRVFEPFHRTEPSRNRETGGVGLGLPIARNILRAGGGDVTLANRPESGARATVTLPA
jgi:signal transduction histidine kinase